MRLRLALLVVAAMALAVAASSAIASSDEPGEVAQAPVDAARIRERSPSSPVAASEGWSRDLERELMSPFCPGRTLVECPSPDATELRLWIQGQEKAGISRAAVEERLFRQFGDKLRSAPRAEGWGLWAYLVPAGALLGGGVLAFGFLRRQGRPAPTAKVPALTDPDLAREIDREIDQELGAP